MMNDIRNKEDIVILVDAFYDQVKFDPLIGPVFFKSYIGRTVAETFIKNV